MCKNPLFLSQQWSLLLLKCLVGSMPAKIKGNFESMLANYNECKTVRIDEYAGTGIKVGRNGFNIKGAADFLTEWRNKCEVVCSKGSIYKTYIKALRNWLLDCDYLICAPTDMIVILNKPKSELTVTGIPEEYTLRYFKKMEEKGEFIMENDRKKASFPDYDIIPIFHDVEEMVTKSIIETLSKDSRL